MNIFNNSFLLKTRTFLLSLVVLSFLGPSPVHAISGGEKVLGDPKVVAIIHWQVNGIGEATCSGALISPRIVLTSAHCLSRNPLDGKFPSYQTALPTTGRLTETDAPLWVVAPGAQVDLTDSTPRAKAIAQFPSPRYKDGYCLKDNPSQCFGPIYDFGVIVLDRALSDKIYRIANAEELKELVNTNAEIVSLGYGLTSHEEYLGKAKRDGTPRKFSSKVRSDLLQIDKNRLAYYPPMMLLQTINKSGQYSCGADSGMPAWFEKNGEWIYIGAAGSGMGPECSIAPENPFWKDPFWSVNSGDHYDTAQAYPDELIAAETFLYKEIANEQDKLNKQITNAKAEIQAALEAQGKVEAELKLTQGLLQKIQEDYAKVKNEFDSIRLQGNELAAVSSQMKKENASLKKKLGIICKAKPKPKGC